MLNKTHLHRVDLNLLVLFHVVLEELHVGRAAHRLSISSSAVSHGLTRLRRLLNDPLFLKTPKGVVPTARAMTLAEPIREILHRVGHVVDSAGEFNPAIATRRFIISAPDSVSAVLLQPLLERLKTVGPSIDIGIRQLLPAQGDNSPDRAWRVALDELEARAMDVAVLPTDHVPTRFHKRRLFIEDFVLAMRAGHSYAKRATLANYCAAEHVVVSLNADPYGFIDRALEAHELRRRVAVTVPNFMLALAVVAQSDMIVAVPRAFAGMHASRFKLIVKELPIAIAPSTLNAVVPKVAMLDPGVAWLFERLVESSPGKQRKV